MAQVFLDIDIGDAQQHAKEVAAYELAQQFVGKVGPQVRRPAAAGGCSCGSGRLFRASPAGSHIRVGQCPRQLCVLLTVWLARNTGGAGRRGEGDGAADVCSRPLLVCQGGQHSPAGGIQFGRGWQRAYGVVSCYARLRKFGLGLPMSLHGDCAPQGAIRLDAPTPLRAGRIVIELLDKEVGQRGWLSPAGLPAAQRGGWLGLEL